MPLSVDDAMKTRRSIRSYSLKRVPKKAILHALRMAIQAPSAHNAQPWRFIIISEKKLKKHLAERMATQWIQDMAKDQVPLKTREDLAEKSIERFTNVPTLIVACVTMQDMNHYSDKLRQTCENVMTTQSVAAAIQNLLLAFHSQGLGACWLCTPLFCQEVVREVLKIPREVEPQAFITVGYASGKPNPASRRRIKDIAYPNYWGKKL